MKKKMSMALTARHGLLVALSALLTLFACSKDGDDDGGVVDPDTGNEILSFSFGIDGEEVGIDQDENTITVEVPNGTDVTSLTPTIEVSEGASVDPESGVTQDFSEPQTYTVTPQIGEEREYVVTVEERPGNEILSFSFGIDGEEVDIDQDENTITVEVPNGTDIINLTPTIEVSEGASVDPQSGVTQDFSEPQTYTVTPEIGDNRQYVVTVNTGPEPIDCDECFTITFDGTLTVTIPTNPDFSYNYEVDSNGDGIFEGTFTGDATFNFATNGFHTLRIRGQFPAIQFGSAAGAAIADKVVSLDQWGEVLWQSMEGAFKGCVNMEVSATDVPNLSNVEDMSSMFEEAAKANPDVSGWNVSNVKDMSNMFAGATSATLAGENMTDWNVSNVTDMSSMFEGATEANPDVANWTVDKVIDMSSMFAGAESANPSVAEWNVNSVENMASMFAGAIDANPEVNDWNVGSVTNMSSMFADSGFDQEIRWLALHDNVNMAHIFDNSKMSAVNFTITLYVLESRINVRNAVLGASGIKVASFELKENPCAPLDCPIVLAKSHKSILSGQAKQLGWTIVGWQNDGSKATGEAVTNRSETLDKQGIINQDVFVDNAKL